MATEQPVPNPHRDEPVPAPQEGTRPGTDPAVRPEQDEELGPLPGLLSTASAEVQEEAGLADAEDHDQLDDAGVEEEGIESGQIMGITAAILVCVAILAFVVFWAFYLPELGEAENEAQDEVELTPEGRSINAEGQARLENYGLTADSTFTLPINLAMEREVAKYAGRSASAALAGEEVRDEMPMVTTRQGFNTAAVQVHLAPARAVRAASSRGPLTAPTPTTGTLDPDITELDVRTGEQVGVDEFAEPLLDDDADDQ